MSIRAHEDWETHGVDYILTYSDNPEANIPRYIYNWMVNKGGPYFLRQVHKAAREIEESGKVVRSATGKAKHQKETRKLAEKQRMDAEKAEKEAAEIEKEKEKLKKSTEKTAKRFTPAAGPFQFQSEKSV
ncbi:unnamed protein product [Caenorhabditis angaria]|uniref:START domain-containing protein n=1 Tax=Caenorhabditis angaria TaxID=860376 RepID=A0A9P1IQS6_9PELO|nr:unnamed protein product [Caenorhabditis angaria]